MARQIVFWGINMGLNILNLTKWPRWLYDTKIQDDVEVTLKDHFQCAGLVLFNQVRVRVWQCLHACSP